MEHFLDWQAGFWCSGVREVSFILMKRRIELAACAFLFFSLAFAETAKPATIAAAEAKNHIGENATVCGKVVSARISKYAVGQRGRPITFDLDEPPPHRIFSFVSLSPDSNSLEQTKNYYTGKHVCVSGTITKVGLAPQIIVTETSHIKVQPEQQN